MVEIIVVCVAANEKVHFYGAISFGVAFYFVRSSKNEKKMAHGFVDVPFGRAVVWVAVV